MKRLTIAIALLLIAVPCFAGGFSGKASNEIADITYLLRCWDDYVTPNQSYTNGQAIDSAAEGCESGNLTVLDTAAGSLSSASNKLSIVGAGSDCWNTTLSVGGSSVTNVDGLAMFGTYNVTNDGDDGIRIGFNSNTPPNLAGIYSYIAFNGSATFSGWVAGTAFPGVYNPIATGTNYQFAIVNGGKKSTGIPCISTDAKGDCAYGASVFLKGGVLTNWTLMWTGGLLATTPIYPFLFTSNSMTGTMSNLLIPNYDFSAVLQPAHLSTFGTDGELSAYTPDVGGLWTETSGDWDTATGKVLATTAGIATFEGSTPYVVYDAKLTIPASGTTGAGMIAKYVDATHYWMVEAVAGSTGNILLKEVNTSTTTRATASKGMSAGNEYSFRLITSSTTPFWSIYADGVANGTYTTEGSSPAATLFGLYDLGNSNMSFDVIGLWPRTCTTCTTLFGYVGY